MKVTIELSTNIFNNYYYLLYRLSVWPWNLRSIIDQRHQSYFLNHLLIATTYNKLQVLSLPLYKFIFRVMYIACRYIIGGFKCELEFKLYFYALHVGRIIFYHEEAMCKLAYNYANIGTS
jgi:hypothetical protein